MPWPPLVPNQQMSHRLQPAPEKSIVSLLSACATSADDFRAFTSLELLPMSPRCNVEQLCVWRLGSPAPPHWRAPIALSRCCQPCCCCWGGPGVASRPPRLLLRVCRGGRRRAALAGVGSAHVASPALRQTCRTAWPAPAGCSAGCPCPWAARSWACRPCQSQTRCSRGWQRCGRLRGGEKEGRAGG